jgi:hypothetical protein
MLYNGSRSVAEIAEAIHQFLAKRVEISLDGVLVLGDLANDCSRSYYGDFGRMKPKNKSFDD